MLTREMVDRAEAIVSMGCGVEESCPAGLLGDVRDWGIDDPYGKEIEAYRQARDIIKEKVLSLLEELGPIS